MMCMKREFIVLLIFMMLSWMSFSQGGDNPFDIAERADSTRILEIPGRENPFDLIHRSQNPGEDYNPFDVNKQFNQNANRLEQMSPDQKKIPRDNQELANFNFFLYSGILILFTFLFTIYRTLIRQIYRAFLNENILKLLHREQIHFVKIPYLIWYVFFFISLSAFIIQAGIISTFSNELLLWKNFFWLLLGVSALFLLKHIVLLTIGLVFPLDKEMGVYSFTIIVFSIILGLFLLPVNLLIAFGPEGWQQPMIILGFLIILFSYGFRTLRVLILTSGKWSTNFFHFFTYLCTVEIAPVIVLFKLLMG